MKFSTITALGLCIAVFPLTRPAALGDTGLRLVDDGKPNAVIVLSANPSPAAVEGAEILSVHLFQISGARLKTLREDRLDDAARSGVRILVGESESAAALGANADDLGPGGILIRTYPQGLVLLGPDRRTPTDTAGTRYAVTTFLEDALGVRFLWPGELGKVVPKRRTIEIAATDHRYTPPIAQRRIRPAGV